MSLLESSHRMNQNICRLQGLRACPYNGQPQRGVPTMSLLESNHRMHQNICRLQGPRACPYNGQPQGVVPTMSLLESNHRMHQNIRRLQGPPCLSRRCRCWNPITGCTKISAGCKAPRVCPDDVVVGIQSPDAPKYLPVARPPCLSL